MSKEDILVMFQTDFDNPASFKSGEYLREYIFKRAKNIILTDRNGLVDALNEWIKSRTEPRTMLAVYLARELRM